MPITFRVKVALLISGVILLLGVTAVLNARNDMRRILASELERRGEAIAKDLAANSTDPVLTGDLVGLYDLVNRTKVNNADIRYILILDPYGQVRVNTFGEGVPRGLLRANTLEPGQQSRLRLLETEEGIIRDVAAPIFEGKAGTVRLGMVDSSIEAAVAQNTWGLIMLVGIAVAVGMAVSYFLSYYLTRPLGSLLAAVQSVARGDLTQRIASPSRDEVGQLGRAFNLMARELESKEAARSDLMKKVISSQEEERKRVARELHDELAQQLTSVLFSLEAVEGTLRGDVNGARQAVRRARQATESSLAETRKLIQDLRPTVLDDLGLVSAIRSYAESHLQPLEIKVQVHVSNLPQTLPSAVSIAVFRIVQEAINNIARHTRAQHARISLEGVNGRLVGEVADDGQGFQLTGLDSHSGSSGAGLGLRGMEERAALLGGVLSVTSQIGQGTRVSFSIPLDMGGAHA